MKCSQRSNKPLKLGLHQIFSHLKQWCVTVMGLKFATVISFSVVRRIVVYGEAWYELNYQYGFVEEPSINFFCS